LPGKRSLDFDGRMITAGMAWLDHLLQALAPLQ